MRCGWSERGALVELDHGAAREGAGVAATLWRGVGAAWFVRPPRTAAVLTHLCITYLVCAVVSKLAHTLGTLVTVKLRGPRVPCLPPSSASPSAARRVAASISSTALAAALAATRAGPSRSSMMLYAGLTAAPPAFNHAGTPPGITHSFDCAARKAAYSFGQALLPGRGDFKSLFQALQLQACNMSTPAVMDEYRPPTYGPPAGAALYVDPHGDDANPGTLERPLRSIAAAVARSAGKASGPLGATILLRGGTHYTPETVEIGPEHSGLTIQNYQVRLRAKP